MCIITSQNTLLDNFLAMAVSVFFNPVRKGYYCCFLFWSMGKDLNIFTDVCTFRSIKLLEASETDGFENKAENVAIWTGMIICWNLTEISTVTEIQ